MRIGVLSDTHVPIASPGLSDELLSALSKCDLIVHAGDLVEISVLNKLKTVSEVKAVHGNMDSLRVKNILPPRLLIEAQGFKIGVMHGFGPSLTVPQKVLNAFVPRPDIIIFGHSHNPLCKEDSGTLLFNPGSATDRLLSKKGTYGIIELSDGKIRPEIHTCL